MARIIFLAGAALLWGGLADAQPAQNPVLLADANKDGKVSRAEYLTSRRGFILEADKDRDGRVSGEEWRKGAARLRMEIQRTGTPGASRIGHGDMFAQIDGDHDGFVSGREIDAFADPRFASVDTNKDGVATREEIRQAERRIPGG